MSALDDRALLLARGWREITPGMWLPHDAGPKANPLPFAVVRITRRNEDAEHARERGSVTYRPTEDAVKLVPALAKLPAGATERDAIVELLREVRSLRTFNRGDLL